MSIMAGTLLCINYCREERVSRQLHEPVFYFNPELR